MGGFGIELQRRRMVRKLSCAELAHLAGCAAPSIGRWETGKRHPAQATVRQLADALRLDGAERDDFFLAAGYTPSEGWGLTPREPLVEWLRALLAHPAMAGAARERFLAPALRAIGITAAALLVNRGVAFEDLPPPPAGAGLSAEVVAHEMRFGIALMED